MTSLRWTFIQLSHCTMCPLYVSPFFSSTSCVDETRGQPPRDPCNCCVGVHSPLGAW